MELININNGKVAKSLFNLKDKLNLIKVLNHPNYGKCLIVGVDNALVYTTIIGIEFDLYILLNSLNVSISVCSNLVSVIQYHIQWTK